MKISFVIILFAALFGCCFAQSGGFLSSSSTTEGGDILSSFENFEDTENIISEELAEELMISEEEGRVSELEIEANDDEGYILLDESEISGNSEINMMLFDSTQYIIQEGIKKQTLLPDTFYFISQIYSIEVQEANRENYRVNLEIADEKNNTANTTYLANYQYENSTTTVTSYSLSNLTGPILNDIPVPGNSTNVDGEFIPIDLNEVSTNMTLLLIGVTGIDYVVSNAVLYGQLPDGYYSPTEINNVASQNVAYGVNYLWDLQVSDFYGNSAELVFVVFYDPVTYDIQVIKSQVLNIVRVF